MVINFLKIFTEAIIYTVELIVFYYKPHIIIKIIITIIRMRISQIIIKKNLKNMIYKCILVY